jgi:hypothetical protein
MEEPDVRLIRLLVRFWILLALALTFERILVVANFIALVPPPDKACSQTQFYCWVFPMFVLSLSWQNYRD